MQVEGRDGVDLAPVIGLVFGPSYPDSTYVVVVRLGGGICAYEFAVGAFD